MTIFQKRTTPQRIVFAVVFVIFSLYALSLLYPFIWAFYNSMKTMDEYRDNTFSLPDRFNLTNYAEAFRSFKISTSGGGEVGLVRMFLNSILLTSLTTFLAVIGSSCVAYVISKFKFRGSGFVYTAAVFIMIVPTIGSTPALYRLMENMGLKNNLVACAMIMGGCFGMYFMMMYGTFQSLSWTYAEAGYIDGANDFIIFVKFYLPLSGAGLATIGLFTALGYWNNWYNAMMYINKADLYPLQYLLYQMLTSITGLRDAASKAGLVVADMPDETFKMAMAVITTGPIILLYPFVQKYFVKGLTVGSVKG